MIRIHVYNADSLVSEFEGKEDKEISIGRAAGASIVLDDPTISRLHAVIFPLNGGWVLQRKANFGAVLLNGTEVENAPLEGGEEVTIGPYSLRVEIEAAQPTSLTGPQSVTSSKALANRDQTGSLDVGGGGDGRTKFVNAGVSALFRMEPGSANLDEFLMEKDVVLFGRGSNCDVVLTEKKASRKHFEVRRQGLSFFLKDLNSANGTVVNGAAVTEAELVAGDQIQVGESKIQFSIENKAFFAQQDQFLPVPAHLSQAAHVDMGGLASVDGGGTPAASEGPALGPDGTPLPPKPNSSTDFIGHAKYRWAQIPKAQRMRYLTILVVGCLVMAFLGTPDSDVKPPPKKQTTGGNVRRFEDLTDKNKKYVKDNYKELLEARERKDYTKMVETSAHILSLVDDYNDTKSYEAIAKHGLDQIEEERKRRENEEKQKKVREEVAKLEEKGDVIFEKALKDPKARGDLDGVIQEIYAKDPNNHKAAEWKQKIKDAIEEEKRAAELARQKEELRQKAEDEFARVDKIFKSEKYIDAMKEADKLGDVGYNEKEFLDRVEKLKSDIREKLHSVLDPLLTEARNQRQEGGDLVKARDRYNEVLHVDPQNEEARHGLNEIRSVLTLRAKRFYNEGILAESVSDLTEAKEKYEKCFHTAPDDPNLLPNQDYRQRCRRKLVRYDAFTPEPAGRN